MRRFRSLRVLLVVAVLVGRADGFCRRGVVSMLRNQDRPELLLVVGDVSAAQRPGMTRLVEEASLASTPTLWLAGQDDECMAWPCEEPLPCPRALQLARESLEIEPDGFGGGDGFGRGQSQARRAPLAARCVVLATTVDACVAGRCAGMRVVGLGEDPALDEASDVVFADFDDPSWYCEFDDLYTPGSFWVNPPVPRTLDGMHCDPYSGQQLQYDAYGDKVLVVGDDAERHNGGGDDDDLAAILADLADPDDVFDGKGLRR